MNRMSIILPPLDHFSSRKEWEKVCWNEILKSGKFSELPFTPSERHKLVGRIAVINFFSAGKRFQEIVKELQLSPQTVSSIKKAIKGRDYRSYWERSKTERKKKIYSIDHSQKEKKFHGRYFHTKYGRVRMP